MSQDGAGVVTTYYAGPHYEVRAGRRRPRYRLGDRLVALRLADGRRQYVHGDALGSTLALTDAAGIKNGSECPQIAGSASLLIGIGHLLPQNLANRPALG